MQVTYKFRAYPTPAQVCRLREIQDGTACAWNAVLGELTRRSQGQRIRTSQIDLNKMNVYSLVDNTAAKKLTRLLRAPAEARRDAAKLAITAWDCWVANTPKGRGKPQFHKPGRPGPIRIDQLAAAYRSGDPTMSGCLTKWKLDLVFKQHREFPNPPKSAHISEDDQGRWWVGFVVERPVIERSNGRTIGIDVGVKNLIYTSEGRTLLAPTVNVRAARRKAKLQASAARYKQGGNAQRRLTERAKRIERDSSQRQRECEWHIAGLLQPYTLKMENLQLKNMSARGRGKRRLNAGLRMVRLASLAAAIEQKQQEAGRSRTLVWAAGTSITCSACGHRDKKSRYARASFRCTKCGFETHADFNAAINISNREGVEASVRTAKRRRVNDSIVRMGKNRWSKAKTETKPAEAQPGSQSDLTLTSPPTAMKCRK